MAQNIAIQEGNQGKQFGHINKLKISNQGGGTSLWVPEDEVKTKSLYASENGTYLASKDEVYGYDEVTVNITKEVVGWKYDEDTGEIDGLYDIEVGDDDFFEEDDEGEIEEELPTSIKITVPPKRTAYEYGEDIDLTGIEVTAYCYDGRVWTNEDYPDGIIPIEELEFDPQKAGEGHGGHIYEKDGIRAIALDCNVYREGGYYSPGNSGYICPQWCWHGNAVGFGESWRFLCRGSAGVAWATKYEGIIYFVIPDSTSVQTALCRAEDGTRSVGSNPWYCGTNGVFGRRGHTVESMPDIAGSIPTSKVDPRGKDFSNPVPKGEEVKVTWNCPFATEVGDETIDMSDSYDITIVVGGNEGHGN